MPGLANPKFAAQPNPPSVTVASTAPEYGISVVSLAPAAGFSQFAVMGAPATAFSSEVDTASREENASKNKD
jgi:hypothetical protein